MAQIFKITNDRNFSQLSECAKLIKQGKLVVFPTETVYGLGANALDDEAVKKIFLAKGRPSDNPLIVHISDRNMLETVVEDISDQAKKLMRCFWPGPLTIIFNKKDIIPHSITCNLPTVAVRMPSHPIARQLIKESGVPIAAPSANISGKPSTTIAQHVIDDLREKVDAIIDGGESSIGLESTVIDVSGEIPILLRPGGITLEQLQLCLGTQVKVDNPNSERPKSPGMKYRHYAPNTRLILSSGNTEEEMQEKIRSLSEKLVSEGKKVAIIGSVETSEEIHCNDNCDFYCIGPRGDLNYIAAHMFRLLRDIDKKGYDYILIGSCGEEGIGLALMNRLKKAASKTI